jgi:hypothetical protein
MNQEKLLELEIENKRLRDIFLEMRDGRKVVEINPGLYHHHWEKIPPDILIERALSHPTPSYSNILKLARAAIAWHHELTKEGEVRCYTDSFLSIDAEERVAQKLFEAAASLSQEEINLLEGVE